MNTTIAYIMGPGRSGTTILEVLLSNTPGVIGAGELTHLFQDGMISGAACTCGRNIDECEFWGSVIRRMNLSYEKGRYSALILKQNDWHTALIKSLRETQPKSDWRQYQLLNEFLFESIEQIQSAKLIVDSSKYAARALNLHRIFPGKVKVICIQRSPEGLMHSFIKPNKDEQRKKSLASIIIYHMLVTLSLFFAMRRLNTDVITIHYEDLIQAPLQVLDTLERFLEIDLTESKKKIEQSTVLDIGHIVTGNRLRKNKNLIFRQGLPSVVAPNFIQRMALLSMHGWEAILGMSNKSHQPVNRMRSV